MEVKLRHVRRTLSPFTPEDMIEIGNAVLASVKTRISNGLDVHNQPAKPLKPTVHVDKSGKLADLVPYPIQKQRRGRKPIRDLMNTGALMSSIQVVSASEEKCTIASNNTIKDKVLHRNNKRSPEFGLSDTDKQVLQQKFREVLQKKIAALR